MQRTNDRVSGGFFGRASGRFFSGFSQGWRRASCALLFAFAAVGCGSSSEETNADSALANQTVSALIAHGTVPRWPEATEHLSFDFSPDGSVADAELGPSRPSGLEAFWSIASTSPDTGFFYADWTRGTAETRVAYAEGVSRITQIRDASKLAFSRTSVGPVPVGGIVVVEHAPSHRYLAIVLDSIEPTDPKTAGAGPYAYAAVDWYLTEPGSVDFGAR